MDLYSINRLTLQDVDNKIKPLADQREKLEKELDLLEGEINKFGLDNNDIVHTAKNLIDVLNKNDLQEARYLLSVLIKRIVIDDDKVYIHWSFV